MDTDVNNAAPIPQSQADLPWDSLIDTFPFLTNQAHRALSIQLDFFRNMSTMNFPIPQEANAKDKLTAILDKTKLVNELISSLTHSSELLIELKGIEYDEVIDARREEISSMIGEAGDNIEKSRFQDFTMLLYHQPNLKGYNSVPLNNPVPAHPQAPPTHGQAPVLGQASGHGQFSTHIQAPAHAQNPGHVQLPAHPLPQTVPVQRRDSVYTETSSDDSDIRRILVKELKKQKQKDRVAKRMAKMKRERDRGDFCFVHDVPRSSSTFESPKLIDIISRPQSRLESLEHLGHSVRMDTARVFEPLSRHEPNPVEISIFAFDKLWVELHLQEYFWVYHCVPATDMV
ncbi:hypothetical protein FACUT_4222 [Fusarium acutatum]|uniref:Uncharacterized protein n=1 Tax=Fusarium acutatum TaxID=78861 RepID=A0A8H4JUJ1_9HYPO|nr:hypothetical protein FACUT_4222 [Fusarium acutatum]